MGVGAASGTAGSAAPIPPSPEAADAIGEAPG